MTDQTLKLPGRNLKRQKGPFQRNAFHMRRPILPPRSSTKPFGAHQDVDPVTYLLATALKLNRICLPKPHVCFLKMGEVVAYRNSDSAWIISRNSRIHHRLPKAETSKGYNSSYSFLQIESAERVLCPGFLGRVHLFCFNSWLPETVNPRQAFQKDTRKIPEQGGLGSAFRA